MTTEPETRSLHRKLAQVMWEAERIPKNGLAPPAMGGFAFVQVGDAADFIRKALAEKVITMMPTAVRVISQADRPTKAGGSMTTVDIMTDWTLTDGESGESIVIQSYGAGADAGDKYSGKAQTNAMKYALLMGFLLSTGDDPEGADSSDRQGVAPAPQLHRAALAPAAAARPAPPRLPPHPAAPAEALVKTPAEAAEAVAFKRAERLAATLPEEPEGLFPAAADDGLVAAAMALAAEQRMWKEGDKHDPAHKGLIRNARGLFCPTSLGDGKWCQFTDRAS